MRSGRHGYCWGSPMVIGDRTVIPLVHITCQAGDAGAAAAATPVALFFIQAGQAWWAPLQEGFSGADLPLLVEEAGWGRGLAMME